MTGKEWVYHKTVHELLENQKKEFLQDLGEILERIVFHTENPDSELMDEITEYYNNWEARIK